MSWLKRIDGALATMADDPAPADDAVLRSSEAAHPDGEDESPTAADDVAHVCVLGRFVVHRGGEDMTPPAGMAANVVKILAVRGAGVHLDELAEEIGRASCRERVCQYV